MRIEGLTKYQRRRRKGSHFEDVPAHLRPIARMWLEKFIARRRAVGLPVRGWLKGILHGQAKRLALKPCGSEWGRRMRARKGGLAVQRRYWREGRNPTAIATHLRLLKADRRTAAKDDCTSAPYRPPFSGAPTRIMGSSRHRPTPQDLAKQIADQVGYRLSSDDRFQRNAGIQPSAWEWEVWVMPVP